MSTNIGGSGADPSFTGYNIDNLGSINSIKVLDLTSNNVVTDTSQQSQSTAGGTSPGGVIQLAPPSSNAYLSPNDIQTINSLFVDPSASATANQTSALTTGAQIANSLSILAGDQPTLDQQTEIAQAESDYGDGFVSAATNAGVSPDDLQSQASSINKETSSLLASYFSQSPGSDLTPAQQLQVILSVQAPGNEDITSPQDPAVTQAVQQLQTQIASDPNIPSWATSVLPSTEQIGADQVTYGNAFVDAALANGVSPDDVPTTAANANLEMNNTLATFFATYTQTPALTSDEQLQVLFQVLVPDSDCPPNPNIDAAVKALRAQIASNPNIPTWMQTTPPASSMMPKDDNSPTGQLVAQMANQNDQMFEQALAVSTINGQPLTPTQIAILQYAHYNPQNNASLPADLATVLQSCESQFQSLYGYSDSYTAPTDFTDLNNTINGAFATNLMIALASATPALTDAQIADIAQYASDPASAPPQYQVILGVAVVQATEATKVEFPGLPSTWSPTVFPVLTVAGIEASRKTQATLSMLNEQAQVAETYINSMPPGANQDSYLAYLKVVNGALSKLQSNLYIIEEEKSAVTSMLTHIQNTIQEESQKALAELQKKAQVKPKPKHTSWLSHFITAITVACILIAATLAEVATFGAAVALYAFAIAYSVDAIQADATGKPSGFQQAFTDTQKAIEARFPGEGGKIFAFLVTAIMVGVSCLGNPEVGMMLLLQDSGVISSFVATLGLPPSEVAKATMILTYVVMAVTIVYSFKSAIKTGAARAADSVANICTKVATACGKIAEKGLAEFIKDSVDISTALGKIQTKLTEMMAKLKDTESLKAAADDGQTKFNANADATQLTTLADASAKVADIEKTIAKAVEDGEEVPATLMQELAKLKKLIMDVDEKILTKMEQDSTKTNDQIKEMQKALDAVKKDPNPAVLSRLQAQVKNLTDMETQFKTALSAADKAVDDAKNAQTLADTAKANTFAQKALKAAQQKMEAMSLKIANSAVGKAATKIADSKGAKFVKDAYKNNNLTHHAKQLEQGTTKMNKFLGLDDDSKLLSNTIDTLFLAVGAVTTGMQIQGDVIDIENAEIQRNLAVVKKEMGIIQANLDADIAVIESVIKGLQQSQSDTGQNIVDISGIMKTIVKDQQKMATQITSIRF